VEELLENGARVIILSKGFDERLQTCAETIEMLKAKGIVFHFCRWKKRLRNIINSVGRKW